MSTTPRGETSGVIPALPGSDDVAGSGPAVRSLFTGIVDDAAPFPPASLPAQQAVEEHRRHRAAWYADLVGPLLLPARDADRYAGVTGGDRLRLGVVADPGSADPLRSALDALRILGAADVVALEVPLPRGTDQGAAAADLVARLRREAPADLPAWVEVHREPGWDRALAEIASAGDTVGAKLRTGGTAAEAFPSAEELAAFVRTAVDVDGTFKLTAGLHTAVRGPDPTGAWHHGLLNVVGGVRAALNGADAGEVTEVLAETSPARLASAARRMSDADAAVVRAFFASYGCCVVADPVEDLARLQLVEGAG